ncbi:MAG: hypothetical protein AMJ65_04830 [Phycisphaerae bacterium SG8_4]|nr:MAG: hypothetical protein AMJ65_04830 [Phycisphaerae bacterium SG8_4]
MVDNENSSLSGQQSSENTQTCCPPTSGGEGCCSSGSSGIPQKWRALIFLFVLVAAAAVLANSLMKKSKAAAERSEHSFPAVATGQTVASQSAGTTAEKTADGAESALWGPELDSLAALDEVATDVSAVFILICGQNQQDAQAIVNEIEAATRKIRSRGNRTSAFRLKDDTVEYKNLVEQFSEPTVLAMVKGLGYSAVSEEITEANLLEAFVVASRAPSACCPAGTDPSQCGSADCGLSGCSPSDSK